MNLYRSFGNLMEAWVAEQSPCSSSHWLENDGEDSPTSSLDIGDNLRTESVDSGVETASSDVSFLATSCSVSTCNTEIDTFTPLIEEDDGLSPGPSSCSASSSQSPGRAPGPSLHLKLERALQRTDLRHNQARLTADVVLRRQPRPSYLKQRPASVGVRGQRSESFGGSGTANPPVPLRQMSEVCRRPLSISEHLVEEQSARLSPGFSYLEQVCRMLEDFARQQMHSRTSHTDVDALQDGQLFEPCEAVGRDFSSHQGLKSVEEGWRVSGEPRHQKAYPGRHFRQRSSSDTSIATVHLRKLSADYRGQHLSTGDLLERGEASIQQQKTNKTTTKTWRFKIGSLRREAAPPRDAKCQQMQSSERSSARRRLSQLFRRRRKTLPS